MNDTVVDLSGRPVTPVTPDPVPELVELAVRILDQAKSGKLRGIVYASIDGAGMFQSNWVGGPGTTDTLIAGVLARLVFEYNDALRESDRCSGIPG